MQIASDGRRTFATDYVLPSMDAIKTWRALNQDITHRSLEPKQVRKIPAERYEHINLRKNALKKIEQENQAIF